MQTPTLGRVVLYTLSDADADAINRRRADYAVFRRDADFKNQGAGGRNGHQAYFGNSASGGQQYPALVVRVFGEPSPSVNLQVHLDGNDTFWATSCQEGDEAGQWSWPPRV